MPTLDLPQQQSSTLCPCNVGRSALLPLAELRPPAADRSAPVLSAAVAWLSEFQAAAEDCRAQRTSPPVENLEEY
jgi:hypothetical protein